MEAFFAHAGQKSEILRHGDIIELPWPPMTEQSTSARQRNRREVRVERR